MESSPVTGWISGVTEILTMIVNGLEGPSGVRRSQNYIALEDSSNLDGDETLIVSKAHLVIAAIAEESY